MYPDENFLLFGRRFHVRMLKNVKRKPKTAAMLETIASIANLSDTSCVSGMTALIGQREEKAFAVRQ